MACDCCPCSQAPRPFSTGSGIFKTYYFPALKHPKAALRIKSIVLTVAHKAIWVTQPLTDSSAVPPSFLLLHPPTQVFLFSDTPGCFPSRDCPTCCPALIGKTPNPHPHPQHMKVSACWLQSLIECPVYRETFPAHLFGTSPSCFPLLPVSP